MDVTMNTNAENQVAVFIDYENIEISLRSKRNQDAEVDWSRVMETAVDLGRVILRRAYGDWAIFSSYQRELLGLGIDLVHVTAKRGKNAADIRIVIEAMEMLIGDHRHISHVLLVSGDGDFTELVHRLRANGKVVVGLGISGASAEYLINACDQFIGYRGFATGNHISYGWFTASDGAGFVQNDGGQLVCLFQRSAVFEQDAVFCTFTDTNHDGGGGCQPHGAGAGDDENGR